MYGEAFVFGDDVIYRQRRHVRVAISSVLREENIRPLWLAFLFPLAVKRRAAVEADGWARKSLPGTCIHSHRP